MNFRHIAPAGSPIAPLDMLRAATGALRGRSAATLSEEVVARFGVRHAVATSTGRAGMTMLFRAMRRLRPERTHVVLPSYTCYSLAASAMKAGLRPQLVDIDPETLDFVPGRMAHVDLSRTLAIVATNLYGLPNDLGALRAAATAGGVFLVDDAAQSMGASTTDGWSGTLGDAGIFSFDKGKPASALDGGVVVTNSAEIADALDREAASLASPSLLSSAVPVVKAAIYATMLRPELYWIPNGMPFLGLGRTEYSTEFPVEGPDRFLAALGARALKRLDEYVEARRRNARALIDALRTVTQVHHVRAAAGSNPAYLRLPILLRDRETRDRAIDALRRAGIGATASYPTALADVPPLAEVMRDQAAEATHGRFVADRILTLPTHPYVTVTDVRTMTDILGRVLRSSIEVPAIPAGKQASLCAE